MENDLMRISKDGSGRVTILSGTSPVHLDGKTENYNLYEIDLSLLYYNDRNDRIATELSRQNSEGENTETTFKNDRELYNNRIHNFIKESDKETFKRTKEDIKIKGQIQPAVVLRDGRIIDGNRRYTCLRELSKENQNFSSLKAVILDRDIHHYEKQIKMMELTIQLGSDERVDYSPIDKLVGIYNIIKVKKLLTVEEYKNCTNMSKAKIESDLEIAELLNELLEYMNAPGKFYLAKDMVLDGPIREVHKILKKYKNEIQKEEIKDQLFATLILSTKGDRSRDVRSLGEVLSSPKYSEEFSTKMYTTSEDLRKTFSESNDVSIDTLAEINRDELFKDSAQEVKEIIQKYEYSKISKKPQKFFKDIEEQIKGFNYKNEFETQSGNDLKNIDFILEEIISEINKIKEYIKDVR